MSSPQEEARAPVRRRPRLRPARRRQDGDPLHRRASTAATTSRSPTRPGVARVCEAIAADPSMTRHYTWVPNTVAVVTDGTAVLGLGDIGPAAAMPVMEGKAVLFKQFGGVDAIPICLATTDVEEIIETVVRLAPSFGGINLEDISAPRCFEIERRLKELLDIPVFHDDQHGTAVVALAALQNALRLTGRAPAATRGRDPRRRRRRASRWPGSCSRPGVRDLAVLDRQGVLNSGRARPDAGQARRWPRETADVFGRTRLAGRRDGRRRRLHRRLRRHGARGGRGRRWPPEAIIFALANPNPEVHPDVAHRHAARRRHRPLRLPQPDQQRAGLPRHLPGRLRRRRHRDHRGHEAGRRRRARRRSSATTWPRTSSCRRRSTRASAPRSPPPSPRPPGPTGSPRASGGARGSVLPTGGE